MRKHEPSCKSNQLSSDGTGVSGRVCSTGQAIKVSSSLQFSSLPAGRGIISISVRPTGIFGFTTPVSILGSPTDATLFIAPGRFPFAVRLWPIAVGPRTAAAAGPDAAGALEAGAALPGMRAPAVPKGVARPGGAAWALVPGETAGARPTAGAWPGGSCEV